MCGTDWMELPPSWYSHQPCAFMCMWHAATPPAGRRRSPPWQLQWVRAGAGVVVGLLFGPMTLPPSSLGLLLLTQSTPLLVCGGGSGVNDNTGFALLNMTVRGWWWGGRLQGGRSGRRVC